MTDQTQPAVVLNDGVAMPQFGLGVFQTSARDDNSGRQNGHR